MATIVNDMLPLPVLKLDVSGMNWAVVLLWFKTAIQEKGLWGYSDGSHLCLRQKKLTEFSLSFLDKSTLKLLMLAQNLFSLLLLLLLSQLTFGSKTRALQCYKL